MNIPDLFTMASSALAERKLRSGLTTLMVVIGAALIMSLNGLNAGTSNFINAQLSTLGANVIIVSPSSFGGVFGPPQAQESTVLNAATAKTLEGMRDVIAVVPMIEGVVTIKSSNEMKTVTLAGLDQTKLRYIVPKLEILSGSLVSGTDSVGIVLGYKVAFKDDGTPFAKVGQTVTVELSKIESVGLAQKAVTKKKAFQVKGILNELGNIIYDNRVLVSLPAANSFLEKDWEYSGIDVITRDAAYNDKVEEQIRKIYGKNIGITSPKAIAETINQILSTFNSYIQSIAAVSMIVGAVGIITTLFTSVMERTKEIGLLKAIGFNNRMVLAMFLTEAGIIGSIGGLLGIFAGVGGAYLLANVLPFGPRGAITPVFRTYDLLYVWMLSFLLSLVAGLYPAWRAAELDPIEALRKE